MKAVVFHGVGDIRLDDVSEPKIVKPTDALVRITASAICGTDLHMVRGTVAGMKPGTILGHEAVAIVEETGKDIRNLRVGDRVVVPSTIACGYCSYCRSGYQSQCDNANPNGSHAGTAFFGGPASSGPFQGLQAEYARIPFAATSLMKLPDAIDDDRAILLSDIFPTAYYGADLAEIKDGDTVVVFGCGPVGQFAIASARMLGAERVIAIDRFPYRLQMAKDKAGATEVLNYEEVDILEALAELTGGRGPDACIDAVGLEAHGHGPAFVYDRAKQATMLEPDRPLALREAILACRNGGTVSVIGVYGGFIDKFPMGAIVNRSLTLKSGQCHVQRYMKPLLERIQRGDIDPTFIITHRLPLSEAPRGYRMFVDKKENCEKVVLHA
jgi:threonine dehydrogenase-like Zn-dependent dehydrogenase